MKGDIPQIIKDVGFDFDWDVEKVWALNAPVEEMDMDELIWHFDIPFLWEDGVYNLKPREVLDSPDSHKKEYERTMQADLVHPIDIMQNKGRWLILDGLHRLMKASILDMKKVNVRKLSRDHIPDIANGEGRDKKTETINTYRQSAKSLADKFDNLGARVSDINETFALTQKINPKVFEIGCGNGRDAQEILKRTNDYLGVDISNELIKLARQKVPQGRFEVADIETYAIPSGIDVIFAFASLIHVPKDGLERIMKQVFVSLNIGGLFRLSMKYADGYCETTKKDEFGVRTYFLYSKEDIANMAADYLIIKNELHDLRGQKWLEMLLQKKNA